MSDSAEDKPAEDRPVLRVVTADATPEEVAALVAVLAAAGGGEHSAPPAPRQWNRPERLLRAPRHAGRGAWRASGLPS